MDRDAGALSFRVLGARRRARSIHASREAGSQCVDRVWCTNQFNFLWQHLKRKKNTQQDSNTGERSIERSLNVVKKEKKKKKERRRKTTAKKNV